MQAIYKVIDKIYKRGYTINKMGLNEARLALADFLNIPLINNNYILLDYYSLIHLISGFTIMFLVYKYFKRHNLRFFVLFLLLGLWEVFELVVTATGSTFFRVDSKLNTIWDLMIGMLGGYLYIYVKEKKK